MLVYLYDIIILAKDVKESLKRFQGVLRVANENGPEEMPIFSVLKSSYGRR